MLIQAGLVGHVHLDVLADDHVEAGFGEGQFCYVSVMDGYPVVQADEPIEPTGCFAVLLGEVDGGDSAAVLVGEEAGCSADPATGVEYFVVAGDFGQFGQLAGCDPARGVEVLQHAEVGGLYVVEIHAGCDQGLFDVVSGEAG